MDCWRHPFDLIQSPPSICVFFASQLRIMLSKNLYRLVSKTTSHIAQQRALWSGSKCLGNKVSIVGVGKVGMACAMSIAQADIAHEVALYDIEAVKVGGEVLDMAHAVPFLMTHPPLVYGSDKVEVTANSDLIVVSSGVRQTTGESRLSLVDRNITIFEKLIPELVSASPNATLLIVSNPVDIMTLVAYNVSGLPRSRVLGSGTTLDSGRFRSYLAELFKVNVGSVGGFVVGEHGDSSVALYSLVTIGGVPFYRLLGDNPNLAALNAIQQKVRDSAKTVIEAKGYTDWGIGACVGNIARAILNDTDTVLPVSVSVRGLLPGRPETKNCKDGVIDDLYLSLPSVVNGTGATKVFAPQSGGSATEVTEAVALEQSAQTLLSVIRNVTIPPRRGESDTLPVYAAL